MQQATHAKVYPGFYELPGGHVEDSSRTLWLKKLQRDGSDPEQYCWRDSASPVLSRKNPAAAEGAVPTAIVSTIQLNFVAQAVPSSFIDAFEVKLNPVEHQNYAWVLKEELVQYTLVWAEHNHEGSILL